MVGQLAAPTRFIFYLANNGQEEKKRRGGLVANGQEEKKSRGGTIYDKYDMD